MLGSKIKRFTKIVQSKIEGFVLLDEKKGKQTGQMEIFKAKGLSQQIEYSFSSKEGKMMSEFLPMGEYFLLQGNSSKMCESKGRWDFLQAVEAIIDLWS